MSVATSTGKRPALKPSRAWLRCAWLRFPWILPAETPFLAR